MCYKLSLIRGLLYFTSYDFSLSVFLTVCLLTIAKIKHHSCTSLGISLLDSSHVLYPTYCTYYWIYGMQIKYQY
jgi:hypothetical protein